MPQSATSQVPNPAASPTPAPTPAAPANSTTVQKIENLPGWQWCTAQTPDHHPCASGLGNATSSKADDQLSPSLDGSSAKFDIAGPKAYSNALWWKSFQANPNVSHFTYDLSFYIDKPEAPEALEFDVNQSFGGSRYVWGTECDFKDTGKWDLWDPKGFKWVASKLPCPVLSGNTWHHLTWQFERLNGQVHYISLTLDNQVMPVDVFMNPQQNWSGSDINVAFQLDGNFKQEPYSVWLDEVSLTQW